MRFVKKSEWKRMAMVSELEQKQDVHSEKRKHRTTDVRASLGVSSANRTDRNTTKGNGKLNNTPVSEVLSRLGVRDETNKERRTITGKKPKHIGEVWLGRKRVVRHCCWGKSRNQRL